MAERGVRLPYLRAWRIKRLMTQGDLAHISGVGKSTVVRAELNTGAISFANTRKLAAALEVTPDELINVDPSAKH